MLMSIPTPADATNGKQRVPLAKQADKIKALREIMNASS
jgi:hypothetical protein